MTVYWRPIPSLDPVRPRQALPLAGGWAWFDRVERIERGRRGELVPAAELPDERARVLAAPRAALAGLALDRPRLMGVLNVTPDSFSDGGLFLDPDAARAQGRALIAAGADILDVGGESTRPGAGEVPAEEEARRVVPVIADLVREGAPPVSIDTRKAAVAEAALAAGAVIVNDVSALGHDPGLAPLAAGAGVPVVLMHAKGPPATMQDDPRYEDVLLDVYDALEARVAAAEALGIDRSRLLVDPGIGFGKTVAHNLALLRGLALFHGLGCPVLLGASRKRFIGTIGNAPAPEDRVPGSVAVALAAYVQGVQVLRVHDMIETRQALALYRAATGVGDK